MSDWKTVCAICGKKGKDKEEWTVRQAWLDAGGFGDIPYDARVHRTCDLKEQRNNRKTLTFKEMTKLEPRLLELQQDIIKRAMELPNRWIVRDKAWYEEFKPRFVALVGYDAENPDVWTGDSYHVAYMKLIEPLEA